MNDNSDFEYDLFISYSQAADKNTALELKKLIKRIGIPMWNLRRRKIFLDLDTVGPDKDVSKIEEALATSKFLAFLACPESSKSYYPQLELTTWLTKSKRNWTPFDKNDQPNNLPFPYADVESDRVGRTFLVHTGGSLEVDKDTRDFDWQHTDALPAHLKGVFLTKNSGEDLSLRIYQSIFRNPDNDLNRKQSMLLCAAAIAGAISNPPLTAEQILAKERKVLMTLWTSAGAAVIAIVCAAIIAVWQWNVATKEKDRAERFLYENTLSVASTALSEAEVEKAEYQLNKSPISHRNWEYHYLRNKLNRHCSANYQTTRLLPAALVVNPRGLFLQDSQTLHHYASPLFSSQKGDSMSVKVAAFSADGRMQAIGADGEGLVVRSMEEDKMKILHRDTELKPGIVSLSFSSDTGFLAIGLDNGEAMLLETENWSRMQSFKVDSSKFAFSKLVFSMDGNLLLSGGAYPDSKIRIWNARSGALQQEVPAHFGAGITSMAVNPNNQQFITGSAVGDVVCWDISSASIRWSVKQKERINDLVFARRGGYLATASEDRTVRLYLASTGYEVRSLVGHTAATKRLAVSQDTLTLYSAGADGQCKEWSTASELNPKSVVIGTKPLMTQTVPPQDALAFSSDGKIIYTPDGDDGGLTAVNALTGVPLFTVNHQVGQQIAVAVSSDDKQVATVDQYGVLLLRDASNGNLIRTGTSRFDSSGACELKFSEDSSQITVASSSGEYYTMEVATGKELGRFNARISSDLKFLPMALQEGGNRVAYKHLGASAALEVFDVASGKRLSSIETELANYAALAFTPDGGRLLMTEIADDGRQPVMRKFAIGSPRQVFEANYTSRRYSTHLAWSPDESRLAVADFGGEIRIFSERGFEVCRIPRSGTVLGLKFSPDGCLLACRGATLLEIYDGSQSGFLHRWKSNEMVWSCAFRPGSRDLVATVGETFAFKFDCAKGSRIGPVGNEFRGENQPTALAYSPSGDILVTGGGTLETGVITVHHSNDSGKTSSLEGHAKSVRKIVFDPCGRRLASGSFDGTVRIWDAADFNQLSVSEKHQGTVNAIAFVANGQSYLTGTDRGELNLIETKSGNIQDKLARHAGAINGISASEKLGLIAIGESIGKDQLGGILTVRDLKTLALHSIVPIANAGVDAVEFDPKGRWCCAGLSDGRVLLLSAKDWTTLKEFWIGSPITCISFEGTGELLALSTRGGDLVVMDLNNL